MVTKKVEVNWKFGCANFPELMVTVEDYNPEFRYTKHVDIFSEFRRAAPSGAAYWAETDGFVNFMYHDPRNESGYSGSIHPYP